MFNTFYIQKFYLDKNEKHRFSNKVAAMWKNQATLSAVPLSQKFGQEAA